MTTRNSSNDTSKYHSRGRRALRSAAQRGLLKPFLHAVLRVRVDGRDNLQTVDPARPLIVVANHSSHFDAPLIMTSLPRPLGTRLAAAAAADYFFTKWFSAKATRLFFNAFPVDRDGSGAHQGLAARLLAAGVPLLIFPEGTRSATGDLGQFHTGSARLALSGGATILPLTLVGAGAAWPKGRKVWRRGRPAVRVICHKAVCAEPDETAEQLTERLQAVIEKDLRNSEN